MEKKFLDELARGVAFVKLYGDFSGLVSLTNKYIKSGRVVRPPVRPSNVIWFYVHDQFGKNRKNTARVKQPVIELLNAIYSKGAVGATIEELAAELSRTEAAITNWLSQSRRTLEDLHIDPDAVIVLRQGRYRIAEEYAINVRMRARVRQPA